jgi:aryl-alcohol dehydrogenase-like predicted oxidoreductase
LEYRRLGNTDLLVSRIAFGCEAIGGTDWGRVNEEESLLAVQTALDKGINFFDTADAYGLGQSERILSKGLGSKKKDVVIGTKFGVNWEPDPNGGRARTLVDSSPRHAIQALESSLRRLELDCIPLYQIHWPDPKTPISDTLEVLITAREAGKIRYIGVSNFSVAQVSQAYQFVKLASVQLGYNLLDHNTGDEIARHCRELNMGVIAYGALAQGLLTGKYGLGANFGNDDRRSRLKQFHKAELHKSLEILNSLREVGSRYHKSPSQVAIRWVLDQPSVTCAAIGIKTPAQVEENVAATDWTLGHEDADYLGGLSSTTQTTALASET